MSPSSATCMHGGAGSELQDKVRYAFAARTGAARPVPEKSLGVAALTHDSLLTLISHIRNLTSNEGRIGIVTFVEPECIALRVCGLMRFVGFMRDKAAGAASRSPVGASWAIHIVV